MTLDHIKNCVDAGKTVHWKNSGYTVIKDRRGAYWIRHHNGNCIGLTWVDGVTLNGEEADFFVEEKATDSSEGNSMTPVEQKRA